MASGVAVVGIAIIAGPSVAMTWAGIFGYVAAVLSPVLLLRFVKRPEGWIRFRVRQPSRRSIWMAALVVVLLSASWIIVRVIRGIEDVPDVRGMSLSAAERKLKSVDVLVPVSAIQRRRARLPKGQVMAQQPAPGEHVEGHVTGSLVVSRGVKVPPLVDSTRAQAVGDLQAAGLRVGEVTEQSSSTHPRGTVVEQEPAAGTDANPEEPVDLVVSKGVCVKAVVGKSTAVALRLLRADGFDVALEATFATSQPRGRIVSQQPVEGTCIDSGERVSLTESLGPEPRATITTPRPGKRDAPRRVGNPFRVIGTLRQDQVESRQHFWLVIRAPFGLIPKSLSAEGLPHRSSWSKEISETGEGLPNGRFTLLVIKVNSTANKRIMRWFRRGAASDRYPAFGGDGTDGTGAGQLPGLQILARVPNLKI